MVAAIAKDEVKANSRIDKLDMAIKVVETAVTVLAAVAMIAEVAAVVGEALDR